LRTALDEHAIVATTDPQGKITFVNDKFCAVSQYSRAELLGQDHRVINSGHHPKSFFRNLWATISRGQPWHGEIRNRAKDGSFYWVDTTIVPLLDVTGKPRQYMAIRALITERKKAEADLRASTQEVIDLKTALDQHAIVAITDAEGKITYVNDKFCAVSKYSREELIGQDHRIINSGYHPQSFFRDLWGAITQGRIWRGEIKNKAKDGTFYWVDATIVPFLNQEGKPWQYVAIRADITERKRAEEERAKLEFQNHQLQKSESLNRMAGAIAHHFNNLLMAVMGNLELALNAMPKPAESTHLVANAMQAARQASEVSGLMLTYMGNSFAKREPFDLAEACRQRLPELRAALPNHLVLADDLPAPGPSINANAAQILRILDTLFANACEAHETIPGTIQIRVKTAAAEDIPLFRRFPIDWQSHENRYACLEVTDHGAGISEADFEKLFEPFFSTKFMGRGMGLASALGIVRAHDGTIVVTSQPAQGSVFQVYIPVFTQPAIPRGASAT